MNKLTLVFILFSLILGVGCQVEQTAVSPIPIIAATETGAGTAVSPIPIIAATETGVGTAVFTPTRPATATATPLPTATKTAVASSTTTVPPPTGRLYFLWDPESMAEQYGVLGPFQNLYVALPGETISDWQIEPLLENLVGWPKLVPSPDKTTIALNPLDDRNADGDISQEGYNRGLDWPNIHIYSLLNNSFERATSDYPQSLITTLNDNQIIANYFDQGLVVLNNDGTLSRQLAPPFAERTEWILPSPDRQQLAINYETKQLHLLDTNSGEIKQATQDIGGMIVKAVWSPDSQWVAVAQQATGKFFLIDANTAEVQDVPNLGVTRYPTWSPYPAWSPDSQQVAVVQETPEGFNLLSYHLADKATTVLLSTPAQVKDIIWSPDSSRIAISLWQDEGVTLGMVNTTTSQLDTLWFVPNSRRFSIHSWSPEGQWLLLTVGEMPLFANKNEAFAGLYLVHADTGEAFQLMDTTGFYDPYSFIWLPDMGLANE